MRILIVDDDPIALNTAAFYLEKFGYQTMLADNGRTALEMLAQQEIDMVISDLYMDPIDGLMLCRELRNGSFARYVYFILLTADTDPDTLATGMDAGADDFMVKPFHDQELRVRVRAGERMISLTNELHERHQHVQQAHANLVKANAQLSQAYDTIKNDLEAAARVQKTLLPPPLKFRGLNAEWLFLPCHFLAGDTLGYWQLDENHVGFYLLDVAGHGTPAALLSFSINKTLSQNNRARDGLLKRPLEDRPYYRIAPPEEVVSELNQRFASDESSDIYFTMIYGVINLDTGVVRFTQAGHPPPLWWRTTDGRARAVGDGGFPVAMLAEAEYDAVWLQLSPGDRLLLYSDGVTDCISPGREAFSQARLLRQFEDAAEQPLADVVQGLGRTLICWQGHDRFNDDVTALALEWQPPRP